MDEEELAIIREAHKQQAVRLDMDKLASPRTDTEGVCLESYKVFLKQYKAWAAANRKQLEKESYKVWTPYICFFCLFHVIHAWLEIEFRTPNIYILVAVFFMGGPGLEQYVF